MTSQSARHYGPSARSVRGEAGPPAPGQAYFGYPQPSRVQFPVPQQAQPSRRAQAAQSARPDQPARSSTWPPAVLAGLGTRTVPLRPLPPLRPFRAHSRATRSRVALHLVGYPLAAFLGVLVAVWSLR